MRLRHQVVRKVALALVTLERMYVNVALQLFNALTRHQHLVALGHPPTYASQGGDGLATVHNAAFLDDEAFRRAYNRGKAAAGWDYGIQWRIHVAIWAASTASRLRGDFVEVGTGKGMVMSAVLESLPWKDLDRSLWLFDTFSPHKVDPETGRQDGDVSPYYSGGMEEVAANFSSWPNIHLVRGKLPGVLRGSGIRRVAFLHIDLNFHAAEVACLEHLWNDHLVDGALVLLDDYANRGRDKQYNAMNALGRSLGFQVLSLPTGQGLVQRGPAPKHG